MEAGFRVVWVPLDAEQSEQSITSCLRTEVGGDLPHLGEYSLSTRVARRSTTSLIGISRDSWRNRGLPTATNFPVSPHEVSKRSGYLFVLCFEQYRYICTVETSNGPIVKPGVHTNDFAPIHRLRALKLGHASLATVFRPGRLTLQPILRENLESPVLMYQPITTAVVTDACLNTRWHHGAYTSAVLRESLGLDRVVTVYVA